MIVNTCLRSDQGRGEGITGTKTSNIVHCHSNMYRSIKRALGCDRSVSVSRAIVDSVKDELELVAARALGRVIPDEGVAFFAGAGVPWNQAYPTTKTRGTGSGSRTPG